MNQFLIFSRRRLAAKGFDSFLFLAGGKCRVNRLFNTFQNQKPDKIRKTNLLKLVIEINLQLLLHFPIQIVQISRKLRRGSGIPLIVAEFSTVTLTEKIAKGRRKNPGLGYINLLAERIKQGFDFFLLKKNFTIGLKVVPVERNLFSTLDQNRCFLFL